MADVQRFASTKEVLAAGLALPLYTISRERATLLLPNGEMTVERSSLPAPVEIVLGDGPAINAYKASDIHG